MKSSLRILRASTIATASLAFLALGGSAALAATGGDGGSAQIDVSATCTTVDVESTRDISNVVLRFTDGDTQRFESIDTETASFSGTGDNVGDVIQTVWVKSGNNKADGDGPGYGERFDLDTSGCEEEDATDQGSSTSSTSDEDGDDGEQGTSTGTDAGEEQPDDDGSTDGSDTDTDQGDDVPNDGTDSNGPTDEDDDTSRDSDATPGATVPEGDDAVATTDDEQGNTPAEEDSDDQTDQGAAPATTDTGGDDTATTAAAATAAGDRTTTDTAAADADAGTTPADAAERPADDTEVLGAVEERLVTAAADGVTAADVLPNTGAPALTLALASLLALVTGTGLVRRSRAS